MILEKIANDIVCNAYTWLIANRGREKDWITKNFQAIVMQSLQDIKLAPEFLAPYRSRSLLSTSNLLFKIGEDNKLERLSFFIPRYGRVTESEQQSVQLLNAFLSKAIDNIGASGLTPFYKTILTDRIDRAKKAGVETPIVVMFDTRRIDQFNFKP